MTAIKVNGWFDSACSIRLDAASKSWLKVARPWYYYCFYQWRCANRSEISLVFIRSRDGGKTTGLLSNHTKNKSNWYLIRIFIWVKIHQPDNDIKTNSEAREWYAISRSFSSSISGLLILSGDQKLEKLHSNNPLIQAQKIESRKLK